MLKTMTESPNVTDIHVVAVPFLGTCADGTILAGMWISAGTTPLTSSLCAFCTFLHTLIVAPSGQHASPSWRA